MKRKIRYITVLFLTLATGIWLGFQIKAPFKKLEITTETWSNGLIIKDHSKEAYKTINAEIGDQIESLIKKKWNDDIFIAVIPDISNYKIKIAANNNCEIFEDAILKSLQDWIDQRMWQISEDESIKFNQKQHDKIK